MGRVAVGERFQIKTKLKPRGDQPKAIKELTEGVLQGLRYQTLLGATGTGKTFTIAHVIQNVQKPTLVIAHNKTLTAQLYGEFRELFPDNAVHYFVSYYDYYQPEAYIPETDTYIEKDAEINEEIDRLRHAATASLLERRDVIIVASVSCIYGLGSPQDYYAMSLTLEVGREYDLDEVLRQLVLLQYRRNELAFERATFRLRGDVLEIIPASEEVGYRIEWFGDEVERITVIDPLTGETLSERQRVTIPPATHYVTPEERLRRAIESIEEELEERLRELRAQGKLLEAQRLEQRTRFDLEMLREMGYCPGIENYSRHLDGRKPGEPPWTLLDYFPPDFLVVIDESHVTVPQLRGMYHGDRSRKETLVEYGFRLPSALDNRPLTFEEFEARVKQVIFMSATPGPYERAVSQKLWSRSCGPPASWIPRWRSTLCGAKSTTLFPSSARSRSGASGPWSPPSPKGWPRTSRITWWSWVSAPATCTPRSRPSTAWRSSGICALGNSTSWWA